MTGSNVNTLRDAMAHGWEGRLFVETILLATEKTSIKAAVFTISFC